MLLKIHRSSFSATGACTVNYNMADLLRKQGWIIQLTVSASQCDWSKRKGSKESTVRKYKVESTLYGTSKEHRNYNVNLLMSK